MTDPLRLQRNPRYINSILYSRSVIRAKSLRILTEVPNEENEVMRRYPCLETVFGTMTKIQECESTCLDFFGKQHTFLLGLQWLPFADVNEGLLRVCPTVGWRGSIVVMKKGQKAFVVNMRPSDKYIAEAAVRK